MRGGPDGDTSFSQIEVFVLQGTVAGNLFSPWPPTVGEGVEGRGWGWGVEGRGWE